MGIKSVPYIVDLHELRKALEPFGLDFDAKDQRLVFSPFLPAPWKTFEEVLRPTGDDLRPPFPITKEQYRKSYRENPRYLAVLDFLKKNGPSSLKTVRTALGYGKQTVEKIFDMLEEDGYLGPKRPPWEGSPREFYDKSL